jgi:hypothetical protein
MMTIVTHVHLREGAERDWDAAMRTRRASEGRRARQSAHEGPRLDDPAFGAGAGGSGHRVTRARPTRPAPPSSTRLLDSRPPSSTEIL